MLFTDNITSQLPQRQPKTLSVLRFPDPVLTQVSMPVIGDIKSDARLQNLLDDMVMTMEQMKGLGLAGIQVGVALRVMIVLDPSTGEPRKVINPTVVSVSKEIERKEEGCLSFPGLFLDIKRPRRVEISYFDENGDVVSLKADDQLARAIYHEIDHLDGKTYLDRLSSAERQRALQKHKLAKRKFNQMVKSLSK